MRTIFNKTWKFGAALSMALCIRSAAADAAPTRVDLRSAQTRIKDQGARNTCITFSAVAALEAAYRRAGHGSLDLSEQFLNHMGKMNWLHPDWDEIVAGGEDASESQVGVFGGGGGVGYVIGLSRGLKLVAESLMPYRTSEYTAADHPHLAYSWDDPFWKTQRNQSDFNLDQRFLPRAALTASQAYSIRSARKLISAVSTTAFENELAANREVVWDMIVANPSRTTWTPCPEGSPDSCILGAHSMLLVGYDRSSANPAEHYFIAKNSWGGSMARADGFTYLSYDYVRRYGIAAAVIDSVQPPAPWTEAANYGRWNLNFDGWKGTLDAYHLPGIAQWQLAEYGVTTLDRRVGAFYDAAGQAHRVNGAAIGNRLMFNFDSSNPNLRWDDVSSGRQFVYHHVVSPTYGPMMSGFHRDRDGRSWAGYMRMNGILPGGVRTPRPIALSSFVGSRWDLHFEGKRGTVEATTANNSFLTADERAAYFGVVGTYRPSTGGASSVARLLVSRTDPSIVIVRLPVELPSTSVGGQLYGKHLSHEPGVLTGRGSNARGYEFGFVMIRM
jgi:hypothetical protein